MSESRFFHVSPSGKLTRANTLTELWSSLRNGGYVWLDYCDPTQEQLSPLIERLGIHPLSVEDCLDEDQIPKIEDFPTNTFMLMNRYIYSGGALSVDEVDFMVGKDFVVTVSGHSGDHLRFYDRIEDVTGVGSEILGRGPGFLLYAALNYVVDMKYAAIEALQDEIDAAEEAILKDPANFKPADLMRLRRDLLSLRKSLFHEREILVKICRRDSPFITEKAIFHFRDIYDHLAKFFELVEIYRETITSLLEIYLSMVNNQMAKVSNRTNIGVRRLTLITTIFMPLTLLAGIGGMSEWTMMTGETNWKIAYPAFLFGMAMVGTVSYFIIRWLDRKALARRK